MFDALASLASSHGGITLCHCFGIDDLVTRAKRYNDDVGYGVVLGTLALHDCLLTVMAVPEGTAINLLQTGHPNAIYAAAMLASHSASTSRTAWGFGALRQVGVIGFGLLRSRGRRSGSFAASWCLRPRSREDRAR